MIHKKNISKSNIATNNNGTMVIKTGNRYENGNILDND